LNIDLDLSKVTSDISWKLDLTSWDIMTSIKNRPTNKWTNKPVWSQYLLKDVKYT